MLQTLRFILDHPLTRDRKFAALWGWVAWQIGSRLVPGPVAVPFVDDARLLVSPGMTGATGNVYCGLHEFEDMAYVLHFLRPEDLFVDIGANVGAYTVLAAKAVGARVVAVEPIAQTAAHLQANLALNGIQDRVDLCQVALGRMSGTLRMTQDADTVNHIVGEDESWGGQATEIPVRTLDELLNGRVPRLVKIDVEGFETEVLAGAQGLLRNEGLQAILVELNGNGARYGFSEDELHRQLLALGFTPFRYEPFTRRLDALGGPSSSANTLYLRCPAHAQARVQGGPAWTIQGRML